VSASGRDTPPVGEPPPASPTTPAPLGARRYGWGVGVLALALVIGFALYTLSSHASGTAGVPAGHPLRFFSAPLAASTLDGDANVNPPCKVARHDPRALNVCLLAKRAPLVLGFFVTDSAVCRRGSPRSRSTRHMPPRPGWCARMGGRSRWPTTPTGRSGRCTG
jgi:hypothetical protein